MTRSSNPLSPARLALVAWLALSVALPAPAVDLPDMGDSAGSIISPEQERRLGEGMLREAYRYGVVIDDPEIETWFSGLGHKLAANADSSYDGGFRFFLVEADSINAFAAPGGFIGAHSGLILKSRNESELAAVMAHEICHVTQRHGARMIEAASKMSLPMAIAMLGAIVAAAANPEAGQAALTAVMAGQQQYAINFTRANEKEADRLGIQLLQRSGFDPEAMASFFEQLQLDNRYTDPKHMPEYLRSHPVSVNRIAEARQRTDDMEPQEHRSSLMYYLMREKLRVLTTRDTRLLIEQMEADLQNGNYQSLEVARYGYALALTRNADYDKARVQLDRLLTEQPEEAAFLLARAEVEMRAGNIIGGMDRFEQVAKLFPGYKPAVLGYVKALIDAGEPRQARDLLYDYAYGHDPDQRYYKLLAEAERLSGAPVESYLALAEYYYSLGEVNMAMQQLQIAQREPGIDYYLRERISARLEEIKSANRDPDFDGRMRRRDRSFQR